MVAGLPPFPHLNLSRWREFFAHGIFEINNNPTLGEMCLVFYTLIIFDLSPCGIYALWYRLLIKSSTLRAGLVNNYRM